MKAKHVIGGLALVGLAVGAWFLFRPETEEERRLREPQERVLIGAEKKAYAWELAKKERGGFMV